MKKLLSLTLALAMCFSLVAVSASADFNRSSHSGKTYGTPDDSYDSGFNMDEPEPPYDFDEPEMMPGEFEDSYSDYEDEAFDFGRRPGPGERTGKDDEPERDFEDEFDEDFAYEPIYATGTFGEDIEWTLDGGLLTVSGSGRMYDPTRDTYETGETWLDYADNICYAVIEDGVEDISAFAFYNCYNLTGVEIPESVTEIGYEAFHGCEQLQVVEIPESVTEISELAFSGCTALETVNVPSGVSTLKYGVFSECFMLSDVTLNSGLTYIDDDAFFYNESLEAIVIPGTVKIIGDAFDGCESLVSVIFTGSKPIMADDAFSGSIVYYPADRESWADAELYGAYMMPIDFNHIGELVAAALAEEPETAEAEAAAEPAEEITGVEENETAELTEEPGIEAEEEEGTASAELTEAGAAVEPVIPADSEDEAEAESIPNPDVTSPSEADLEDVTLDKMFVFPDEDSYLDEYKAMTVDTLGGVVVYASYGDCYQQATLSRKASVTAIAQQDDMTCVLYTGRGGVLRAGWIKTADLAEVELP